jgi:E1-E2 ATPase
MGNKAPKLKFGPRGSPDPLFSPFEIGRDSLKGLSPSVDVPVAKIIAQLKSDASQGISGTEADLKARTEQFGTNIWPESPLEHFHEGHFPSPGKLRVWVVRNGEEKQVDASELVVGDIIQLRAGDEVPADGVVIDASDDCAAQEATLTGESLPNPKAAGKVVCATTKIERGHCKVIITAVGENTIYGGVAHMIVRA